MFKFTSGLQRLTPIHLIGYGLIAIGILIGFITRIIAVFQYISFDIGPDPDQIRDAFAVINMWKGDLPTLGPQVTTIGRHHILPLYYYLFFPFTILGADPVFQALPNALFSFLSIPLLIYLIFLLLENVSTPLRIFLSGLGGFWYSVLYGEIFINNFQWNPSSIPFFLLAFTLLYYFQLEGNFSLPIQIILWAGYGFILAILISLHSSTLFIMPIVFVISSSIYIYKIVKKRCYSLISLPIISIVSAIITLLPYWIGEFGRGFLNTKTILKTLVSANASSESSWLVKLGKKISNLLLNYYQLLQEVYLGESSLFYLLISFVFLSLVTYLGITKFKGNKSIWLIWCSTWGLYLYAASNLDPAISFIHYKLLIIFAPVILTVTSLAYVNLSLKKKLILYTFTVIIIIISSLNNLFYDYQFMLAKYGSNKVINTGEIIKIINQLPSDAVICDPRVRGKRTINNQYNYIDTNVTHKGIKVVNICVADNYVIHPKRLLLIDGNFLNDSDYEKPYIWKSTSSDLQKPWPLFKVGDNETISRPSKLVLETDTANVYLLN